MYIDFHTHGKLAKYLPFSTEYTDWLLGEAKRSGLDAICLTEHFNTAQFDELYGYIASKGEQVGDAFAFGGLKVFPGMETDIAEGGHVICVGKMDAPPVNCLTFLTSTTFLWEPDTRSGMADTYRSWTRECLKDSTS